MAPNCEFGALLFLSSAIFILRILLLFEAHIKFQLMIDTKVEHEVNKFEFGFDVKFHL